MLQLIGCLFVVVIIIILIFFSSFFITFFLFGGRVGLWTCGHGCFKSICGIQ